MRKTRLVCLQQSKSLSSHATMTQVKDFTFSPDDGRIDSIKFDRYGLPAVPDSLFSVCGLSVWDVMRVETSRLVVQSSVQISKETDGLLDRATEALFNLQVRNYTPVWIADTVNHVTLTASEARVLAFLLCRALNMQRTINRSCRIGSGNTGPRTVPIMARWLSCICVIHF